MDFNGQVSVRRLLARLTIISLLLQVVIYAPLLSFTVMVLAAVLAAILFPDYFDRQIRFWRLGYEVKLRLGGIPECAYREKGHGQLLFPGNIVEENSLILEVPNKDDWGMRTPAWARGRREEILDRIHAELESVFLIQFGYLEQAPEFPPALDEEEPG